MRDRSRDMNRPLNVIGLGAIVAIIGLGATTVPAQATVTLPSSVSVDSSQQRAVAKTERFRSDSGKLRLAAVARLDNNNARVSLHVRRLDGVKSGKAVMYVEITRAGGAVEGYKPVQSVNRDGVAVFSPGFLLRPGDRATVARLAMLDSRGRVIDRVRGARDGAALREKLSNGHWYGG